MRLPGIAQDIADIIGRDLALYLIGQLPRCQVVDRRTGYAHGRRPFVYVPTVQRLTPDHQLVRILGFRLAERLCRHFGGELLQPPACDEIYRPFRNAGIRRLVAEGVPATMVADWFGMSDRQVRNIAREIPQMEAPSVSNDNRQDKTEWAA